MRHLVTNVLVEVISETEARGTNYLAMLSSHASTEPPQEAGGLYVGGFEDHYVQDRRRVAVQEPLRPRRAAPGRRDAEHPAAERRSERTEE